jgi:hypothetical protein
MSWPHFERVSSRQNSGYGNTVFKSKLVYRNRAEAAHRTGAWPWKSPVRRLRS